MACDFDSDGHIQTLCLDAGFPTMDLCLLQAKGCKCGPGALEQLQLPNSGGTTCENHAVSPPIYASHPFFFPSRYYIPAYIHFNVSTSVLQITQARPVVRQVHL